MRIRCRADLLIRAPEYCSFFCRSITALAESECTTRQVAGERDLAAVARRPATDESDGGDWRASQAHEKVRPRRRACGIGRSSAKKSCGCSQAAKRPFLGSR